jgi:hypothetical protein
MSEEKQEWILAGDIVRASERCSHCGQVLKAEV